VNRSDLIARMAERLGGDRTAAAAAVTGVLEEIEAGVARGERVTLSGFGTFERRARAARTARNPRTGDAVRVEASVVPVFRAGAGFKGLLLHPEGASELLEPASVTGGAQQKTGTKLQVVASPSAATGVPVAVPTADGDGKKLRKAAKKAAEKAAEKDSKAKAGKKARKAKSKAGKKSA
jgi:DNA-binding protein HU-beta